MRTLIRVEWLKMRKYAAFWWVISLTALSYPGINYIFYNIYLNIISQPSRAGQLAKLALGNPFTFPEVWHTTAYFSSLFIFIPAVVVIMLISNEYTFKTMRQNIIDGWSRDQFITSKLIDVLLVCLMITLLYTGVALIMGVVNQDRLIWKTWDQAYYIGLFALQTFSQLSFAFLIGYVVRRAFLALGVFLFYCMILEPIAVGLLKYKLHDEGRFLPLEISDRLIPVPAFFGKIDKESYDKAIAAINLHVILTLIITAVIWALCYRMNRKYDLK